MRQPNCKLELICELDLEYIMRPTGPYVCKGMCAKRDGTPAITMYLPWVATFTMFNQQTIKRYISKVEGDVKITVKF